MGVSRNRNGYMLVNNDMRNVPLSMPKSFSYPTPAPTNPCRYYFQSQVVENLGFEVPVIEISEIGIGTFVIQIINLQSKKLT